MSFVDLLKKRYLKICPIELRCRYMKSELQALGPLSSSIVKCLDNGNFGMFEASSASGFDTKSL